MVLAKHRAERRKKQRIQLTRSILARFGATGALILDITDSGARIEHFSRLDLGRKSRLRFEWQKQDVEVEAIVVSCKVHRFAPGEEVVYQSGLFFTAYTGESATFLRAMVSTLVARSLAEQVANARGVGPLIAMDMPVFRSGVVAGAGDVEPGGEAARRFIPDTAIASQRGYIRCRLISNNRWDKKWTLTGEQPEEGFTVLASEPDENVDQLCATYLHAGEEHRRLIRLLARASVEQE